MISFPPCKINLGLNVIEKRPDGFHAIETCFYPVPWTDILEIIPSDKLTFTSSGISIPGNADHNLCLKAFHLLNNDFDLRPVKIHLHKNLPVGAGLGGGSSDAAHALRLLNSIFDLNINEAQLRKYASTLGSDCSFFITDQPMIGSGRGEILSEIELSLTNKFIVLVNPEIHISTAVAYAGVVPKIPSTRVAEIVTRDIDLWKKELINDFEESIFKQHPEIKKIKSTLYQEGALYSAMSGSGSTVLGIFDKKVDLKNNFTGMKYWSGEL